MGCQSSHIFTIGTGSDVWVRARVSILNAEERKCQNLCQANCGSSIVFFEWIPQGIANRKIDLPRSLRRLTEHKSQVRPDHCNEASTRFPPISCSMHVSLELESPTHHFRNAQALSQAPDFCTWRFSKS